MPNTASAKKRLKQSKDRRGRNKAKRSSLLGVVNKFRNAVNSGQTAIAAELMPEVQSGVDKAAAKGLIHKNKASRMKRRAAASLRRVRPAATSHLDKSRPDGVAAVAATVASNYRNSHLGQRTNRCSELTLYIEEHQMSGHDGRVKVKKFTFELSRSDTPGGNAFLILRDRCPTVTLVLPLVEPHIFGARLSTILREWEGFENAELVLHTLPAEHSKEFSSRSRESVSIKTCAGKQSLTEPEVAEASLLLDDGNVLVLFGDAGDIRIMASEKDRRRKQAWCVLWVDERLPDMFCKLAEALLLEGDPPVPFLDLLHATTQQWLLKMERQYAAQNLLQEPDADPS